MGEGRRYRGLLIGNATFPRDPHALPDLEGPGVDIELLQQALTDDRVGLFRTEDLQCSPDHGIQDIREQVDELFTTAVREDVLLLYYSGHGQLDERGVLYLCARDTSTSRLRASALSAIEINNMIDGSAATTTVVILDCCHSGAFKGAAASAPAAGRGRYVLTSSRSTQLTLAATGSGQPSPFTGLLVRGLKHAEATEHLTVVELYRQVHRWMTEEAVITPQLKIAGEGDVVIAYRPNPLRPMLLTESVPVPEKVPAHLSRTTPDIPATSDDTPAHAPTAPAAKRRKILRLPALLAGALLLPLLAWGGQAIGSAEGLFSNGTPKSPRASNTKTPVRGDAASSHDTPDAKPDTPPTDVPNDPAADIGDEEINTTEIMNLPDCKDESPDSVAWDMKLDPDPPLRGKKVAFEMSWIRKKGEACRFNLGRKAARLTVGVMVTYKEFPGQQDWTKLWQSDACSGTEAQPRWAKLDTSHPLKIAYHWDFQQSNVGCDTITFTEPGFALDYSVESTSFPGRDNPKRVPFTVK